MHVKGGGGMMDGRRFLITGQKTWHKVIKDRKKKNQKEEEKRKSGTVVLNGMHAFYTFFF